MNVKVYWNVTRKCWSVVSAKTGFLEDHTDELFLVDARFTVSEAGRQRVLREKRKNVHARVCGLRATDHWSKWSAVDTRVRYNPYRDSHFVTEDGRRVDYAQFAYFLPSGVLLCGGIRSLNDTTPNQLPRPTAEADNGHESRTREAEARGGRRLARHSAS